MNEFKVGDRVECVNSDEYFSDLNIGQKDIVVRVQGELIYFKDRGGYYSWRFKLVEPNFTPEYFSVLNEREAEKYVGKTMEFTDGHSIDWHKQRLVYIQGKNDRPFSSNQSCWPFTRTCPETFEKKKVKKPIECWAAIFPEGGFEGFYAKKIGAERNKSEKMYYVKLTGEYEVEENKEGI